MVPDSVFEVGGVPREQESHTSRGRAGDSNLPWTDGPRSGFEAEAEGGVEVVARIGLEGDVGLGVDHAGHLVQPIGDDLCVRRPGDRTRVEEVGLDVDAPAAARASIKRAQGTKYKNRKDSQAEREFRRQRQAEAAPEDELAVNKVFA